MDSWKKKNFTLENFKLTLTKENQTLLIETTHIHTKQKFSKKFDDASLTKENPSTNNQLNIELVNKIILEYFESPSSNVTLTMNEDGTLKYKCQNAINQFSRGLMFELKLNEVKEDMLKLTQNKEVEIRASNSTIRSVTEKFSSRLEDLTDILERLNKAQQELKSVSTIKPTLVDLESRVDRLDTEMTEMEEEIQRLVSKRKFQLERLSYVLRL